MPPDSRPSLADALTVVADLSADVDEKKSVLDAACDRLAAAEDDAIAAMKAAKAHRVHTLDRDWFLDDYGDLRHLPSPDAASIPLAPVPPPAAHAACDDPDADPDAGGEILRLDLALHAVDSLGDGDLARLAFRAALDATIEDALDDARRMRRRPRAAEGSSLTGHIGVRPCS